MQAEPHIPSHYVAIGASAGGLEALQNFFSHMPADSDLAFIVIQHLSPDFKSVMDELLARQTNMRILNVVNGTQVEANTIYLIPPRKNMTLSEGRLVLVDQVPNSGNNFPIDIFFHSLAADKGPRSVAIVLSGTGSDGSRGIKAVKEAGGLVMVQDSADAKFDGMPYCAEKTGSADIIAKATELPKRLLQYVSHPLVRGNENSVGSVLQQTEDTMQGIYDLLRANSNVDFSQYKGSTISRRIERQIGLRGLAGIQEYYDFLKSNPEEVGALSIDLLIGVTRFFRDSEAFEYLEESVIPELLENSKQDSNLRIWIAGCSTGEEAYSIAILIDEALNRLSTARNVKIFASDVDPNALAVASNAEYDLNISADISQERLKRYFIENEDHYTLIPAIRQMVVFATHNLLRDPPFSNCHLALCRNVLIYFQSKAQRRTLSMLHFSLQREGYLFLGPSESLGEISKHFDVINDRCRIYQKNSNIRLLPESITPDNQSAPKTKTSRTPTVDNLIRHYQQIQRAPTHFPVLEELINHYIHSCIVLDENLDVLHVYGNTEPYTKKLQAGRFSSNINDMMIEGLKIPVGNILHRIQSEQKSIQYQHIKFQSEDNTQAKINIQALYVCETEHSQPFIALIFEPELEHESYKESEIIAYNPDDESQRLIVNLEKALQQTKQELQLAIEELETTNEELQSSNEELLAANEELQSTNEELQSVNEELYSVNSEYHEKIEELTQATLDLDNIIKSADIGFVFLDHALLIRQFSPLAAKLLNLIDSDLGRPFHHISHSVDYKSIISDISRVITDEVTIEIETLHQTGVTLWVKISPYIDEFNETMGCVISLSDISELKNLEAKLSESHQRLRDTISTAYWKLDDPVKLLIVDDNEVDRMMLTEALNKLNENQSLYQIELASSYNEACEKLGKERYDVCLVDYRLGTHNGFELVTKLRNYTTSPAFIVVSGHIENSMTKEALDLGIYDMIDKQDLSPPLLERSIRYSQRHRISEFYLSSLE